MPSSISRLLALAWPVTLARLGIMGMNVCDVMVIGQLAPAELSFQALGLAPTNVFLVASIGLLTGVQVFAARGLGASSPEHAGGALQRGLVISLVCGALAVVLAQLVGDRMFALFGVEERLVVPAARVTRVLMWSVPLHLVYVSAAFFVEALERPLMSTWVMAGANVVNLIMNLWLVPRWGAIGSAWATVCARFFLAAVLLAWIFRLPDAARLGLRTRPSQPSYRALLSLGAAAALSQAAEAGAFSGMTLIAGRLGGDAVATYQVVLNWLAIVFMCALGMATATAVLTAQAVGRGSPREAAATSWLGLSVNTCLMGVIGAFTVVCAGAIARAYTKDAEIGQAMRVLLPLAAASMIADGGQGVVSSALRALGDNWWPTMSHLLAYAIVMPVLGESLAETHELGVRGLVLAIVWASFLSVGVLMLRLWRLTRVAAGKSHPA
jgi:MATE family multidrug resistance protein